MPALSHIALCKTLYGFSVNQSEIKKPPLRAAGKPTKTMNRLASLLPDWDPPSHPTPWGNTGLDSQTRKSAGGVGPSQSPVAAVAAAGFAVKPEPVATVAGAGSGPPPKISSLDAGGVGPSQSPVAAVAAAGFAVKPEPVDTVAGFGSGPPPKISARPDWLQGTFSAGSLNKLHEFLGYWSAVAKRSLS